MPFFLSLLPVTVVPRVHLPVDHGLFSLLRLGTVTPASGQWSLQHIVVGFRESNERREPDAAKTHETDDKSQVQTDVETKARTRQEPERPRGKRRETRA